MSLDDDYFDISDYLEKNEPSLHKAFKRMNDHYNELDKWQMEWEQIIGALSTVRKFLVGSKLDEGYNHVREYLIDLKKGQGADNITEEDRALANAFGLDMDDL